MCWKAKVENFIKVCLLSKLDSLSTSWSTLARRVLALPGGVEDGDSEGPSPGWTLGRRPWGWRWYALPRRGRHVTGSVSGSNDWSIGQDRRQGRIRPSLARARRGPPPDSDKVGRHPPHPPRLSLQMDKPKHISPQWRDSEPYQAELVFWITDCRFWFLYSRK